MNRAVFLDRDGVLIEEVEYLDDPARARLLPGVPEALRLLRAAGYLLVVVSNQSGVARGYFPETVIAATHAAIDLMLSAADASVDQWRYCPHYPGGKLADLAVECECRKPRPGMLLAAAKELNIDLADSFIIGDKRGDLEAGANAGCRGGFLVRTGHGGKSDGADLPPNSEIADDILAAAKSIAARHPKACFPGIR